MISMLRRLKIADIFTVGNFTCGFLSILFSANMRFTSSAVLMLAAVCLDFLDGRIARHLGQVNEFGKQLDSFSDLVSFGIAPAVFGYMQGLSSVPAVIVLAFFAVCGMLRLSRFNVTDKRGFEGVPITTNGFIFPAVYLVLLYSAQPFNSFMLLLYAAMGLLMVSKLRIRKI